MTLLLRDAESTGLFALVKGDIHAKSNWNYQRTDFVSIVKTLLTDGTAAMIYYRLMQSSMRIGCAPAAMLFNKLNSVFCQCIIGRGAEFGPRFVIIHSQGIVINGKVRGGSDIRLEHQVTIGEQKRGCPRLGNRIFVGAGAKIFGDLQIGDDVNVGANAVVCHDVPSGCTAVGVPARCIPTRTTPCASDSSTAAGELETADLNSER